ncbi:Putative threonine efflux protein [plant metagenome]|uniref:Threonine efflux protein n=2 Tax=root TaxID=1 RepID=A0A1C3K0W7_9BURK|nr:LysE family translocator [Orrella dioscoreae]SBT25146.1 Putative threonine efflux protein [Orrella dioscoreae]SOE50755.1 Putative threonine efflux protein [Orrella dioscoreae]
MLTLTELAWFALAALVLVLTPGPNMIYCISRALCQGRQAGVISLAGVLLGFLVHLVAASVGLTALLAAVPYAFEAIRLLGAAYLLWLAWQSVKPGGQPLFAARALPLDPPAKLFRMGFLTNVLNPKVALFYLSFFPQFLHPERGSILWQSVSLGAVQITVSGVVNLLLVLGAARIAQLLSRHEGWQRAQRYLMGGVLALLALRIATDDRQA